MRIVENFFRFFNAMYFGMMLETAFYDKLSVLDFALLFLNVVALVVWISVDIQRMKMEVQDADK